MKQRPSKTPRGRAAQAQLLVKHPWAGRAAKDLLDAMRAAGFAPTPMGGNVLAFVRRDGERETLVIRSDSDDVPRAMHHPVEVFVQKDGNDVTPPRTYASARAFLATRGVRPNPSAIKALARRKGWEKVVSSYGGGHWVAARREARRGLWRAGTYWELWSPDGTRMWAFSDDRRTPRVKVYRFQRTRAGELARKLTDTFEVPAADLEDGTVWPVRGRAAPTARANPSGPRVVDLWRQAPRRGGTQPNMVYALVRDRHYNTIGLLAVPHRGTTASILAAAEAIGAHVRQLPQRAALPVLLADVRMLATDEARTARWELMSTAGMFPAQSDWIPSALQQAAQMRDEARRGR